MTASIPQLYHLCSWHPSHDMGGCGFNIKLYPAWKDAVAAYALDADAVEHARVTMSKQWLEGFGFPSDEIAIRTSIRLSVGPWGVEHITVPGNACGLDLDDRPFAPSGGRLLSPHNVDSIRQAGLLLAIFSFFADTLVLHQECAQLRISKHG